MYQIWRIYLDLWGHDCKKWVCPTSRCKLCQSDPIVMQLKLDMSCHQLNVYTMFQIDISQHVEEKSGKRERTVGQTDGHCHGIIRPFFKRAYKNGPWIPPCVWRNSDVVIPKLYKRKMIDSMPWAIMYGYSWPHNSNSTHCFIIWHYYNSPMLSKHINCSGMFWHYHFSMIWWQLEDIVTHYEC